MSASSEHEFLVAMAARYIREQGYEVVAIECSLAWLFGDNFRLPPSIILHRPDVVGVRKEAPLICIGEAKTRSDLRSVRTRRQLRDFVDAPVRGIPNGCSVVVAIPDDCKKTFDNVITSLGITAGRVRVLPIPRVLLKPSSRP